MTSVASVSGLGFKPGPLALVKKILGKLRFMYLSSWVKPERFDDDSTRYEVPHDCLLGNTNTNPFAKPSLLLWEHFLLFGCCVFCVGNCFVRVLQFFL